MGGNNQPDYLHFSRRTAISHEEAQFLLASFDLREMNISDPNEYQILLEEKKKLSRSVLYDAINDGLLIFDTNGEPSYVDASGEYYAESNMKVRLDKFLRWASDLNYSLPEIFNKFTKKTEIKQIDEVAYIESSKNQELPKQEGVPIKIIKHKDKSYLTQVVEHVVSRLPELGKSDLNKPRKIREFIILMKQMATKGNRYADEYVMERIKSITVPEEGDCTIVTADNISLKGQSELMKRGKNYSNNDVSKILSGLRKNNMI